MKYIFFDTETTGLPHNYNAPYTDINNWPRLVQLAWIVYDNNSIIARKNYLIKPIGFTIPQSATNIHGVSMANALENGHKIQSILNVFLEDTKDANALIGHNVEFDLKVVQAELYRLNIDNNFSGVTILDTMRLSTNFCKIPNKRYGYRYPKLIELYNILFSESFDNMHNAIADVEATAKCFWAMLDRGIINRNDYPSLFSDQERGESSEPNNNQAAMTNQTGTYIEDKSTIEGKSTKMNDAYYSINLEKFSWTQRLLGRRFAGSLTDKAFILGISIIIAYVFAYNNAQIKENIIDFLICLSMTPKDIYYLALSTTEHISRNPFSNLSTEVEAWYSFYRELELTFLLIFTMIRIVYYCIGELLLGASFGKWIVGFELVEESTNKRVGIKKIMQRAFSFFMIMAVLILIRWIWGVNYLIILIVFLLFVEVPVFLIKKSLLDILTKTSLTNSFKSNKKG